MSRERSAPFRALAFLLLASTAGCQTFQAVPLSSLEQGSRIRVHFEEPAAVELRDLVVQRVTLMDAETVALDNGDLVMSALWLEQAGRAGMPGEAWTVRIPTERIATVEKKQLSWLRSALMGAGILAATIIGWETAGGGGSDGPGDDGGSQK